MSNRAIMPIRIQRKLGTNITWEVNAVFSACFPVGEAIFEIPKLEYMLYLYRNFELIEATDENGEELDLTDICNCCRESIKLELIKRYEAIKSEEEEKEVELEASLDNAKNEDIGTGDYL